MQNSSYSLLILSPPFYHSVSAFLAHLIPVSLRTFLPVILVLFVFIFSFIYLWKPIEKCHRLWKVAMRTPVLEIGDPLEAWLPHIHTYILWTACCMSLPFIHGISWVRAQLISQLTYISNLIWAKLIQNFNSEDVIIARFTDSNPKYCIRVLRISVFEDRIYEKVTLKMSLLHHIFAAKHWG